MESPDSGLRVRVRLTAPIAVAANFYCAAGEIHALAGASGSGKTTLLRMIAGLQKPSEGAIYCGDSTWFDAAGGIFVPAQARHIGYLPQHLGLFPHMTALGNIAAGMLHLPAQAAERRAYEWLSKLGLASFAKRMPAELSGGERQRVALARALAREPSALLLDEPFSAVDLATRDVLYAEIERIRRESQIPVIVVTHDLSEAALLADRMTLMNSGHGLQSGTPREVLLRPATEAAALQVGIRNIFDATVARHDPETGFTSLAFGDALLWAAFKPGLEIGEAVRWCIPSQGIRVRHEASVGEGVGCVKGIVLGSAAAANRSRAGIRVSGSDDPVYVEIPFGSGHDANLRPGIEVVLQFDPRAIHIFS